MGRPASSSSRRAAAFAIAALAGLLGLVLRREGWAPGDTFLRGSYDSLHALSGPVADLASSSPAILVYLDLPSHLVEKQDPARPWPRALHAALVRRLTDAGARAVVFDIVFGDGPADAPGNAELAAALRENGRVILAGQSSADASRATTPDQPRVRMVQVEAPHPLLRSNAVAWGLANHRVDDDLVVRRHFDGYGSQDLPSLSAVVHERFASSNRPAASDGSGPERPPNAGAPGERWLRYYGPALELPHVSYSEVLHATGPALELFRNRVVWIGSRPMAEGFQGRQDEFRSPFHSFRNKYLFVPGVEVHATAFLNRVRGDSLRRLPDTTEQLVLLSVAILAAGLAWLRPPLATLAALAGTGACLASARTAFAGGLWFPWWIVAGAQLPAALFGSWLFHFRDWYVTRRRLEAERRASEARIRDQAALIDKANDAILVHDLAGRVLEANPAAERLYGWSIDELRRGEDVGRDRAPSDAAAARAMATNRGEWSGELLQCRRDGREILVAARWTLIRDEAGRPKSLLAIHTDITERRQLEQESLRLQRSEAIGALASGMAHDLNNALAPVLMGTQLLRREAVSDEARRVLGLMESSTRRGAEMVRQVVLFARGTHGDQERVDPRLLVEEIARLARETFPRQIEVAVHAPPDLWPVRGNPTELHQVLLNLCVNARDAMPQGGRLSLAVDQAALSPADAAALEPAARGEARAGAFVSFLVSDTGTGMPPDVAARIFEPFFTTKGPGHGTGLGLSTSLRIVRAHGGFLALSSKPGEGTTFEVFVPRDESAFARTEAPPAPPPDAPGTAGPEGDPPPRGRGERVLVADDDQAVRELLVQGLVEQGYRAQGVANGAEAVAILRAAPAPGEATVALVVCDHDMPVLDGPGVVAAIQASRPDLRWLLMSGDETPRDGGPAGAPDVVRLARLPKPFPLSVFLARVRDLLDAPPR